MIVSSKIKRAVLTISILVLFLLASISVIAASEGRTYTVINSKDWRSLYLGTMYSGFMDSELLYFKNLADSQLKTNLLRVEDEILVLESRNNPIVKNYESFLRNGDYLNYQTIYFEDYHDLQTFLFDDIETEGIFILDSEFGMSAVAAAPYILTNRYRPLFFSDDDSGYIRSQARGKNTIVSGRIPYRDATKIKADPYILGMPDKVSLETMKLVSEDLNEDWGIITRIDKIDLDTLKQKLPLFIYFGDAHIGGVATVLDDGSASNFEVIGGNTASIAQGIKASVNKDIKMLLKYGRTITSVPGYEGTVLDINSVSFGFPYESLIIESAIYYPNMNIFAVSVKNVGNIDVMFFSSAEFAETPLGEDLTHHIYPGDVKTIPFVMANKVSNVNEASLSTSYGYSVPLLNTIVDNNSLIYKTDVITSEYSENYSLEFVSSKFNHERGFLKITIENNNNEDLFGFSEITINEDIVVSSEMTEFKSNDETVIMIDTPYVQNSDLSDVFLEVNTYFGKEDTLNRMTNQVYIKEFKPGLFTGLASGLVGTTGIIVLALILLIVIAVIVFFLKRFRK